MIVAGKKAAAKVDIKNMKDSMKSEKNINLIMMMSIYQFGIQLVNCMKEEQIME